MAWDMMQLVPNMFLGYTNVLSAPIFFGLLIAALTIGMWRRNRSIKLVSITWVICGALVMTAGSGLSWGIPGEMQKLGGLFLALGVAGILYSFRKS